MRSFEFRKADDLPDALQASSSETAFLAGGTTLVDLMKLDVMRPRTLIDINALATRYGSIGLDSQGLRLGALARMSDVAADLGVRRDFPLIAQSLDLAASPQLRNMATLGGNVLQRTRCPYFRDTSWARCNKRQPGSGCKALDGVNRQHAVLGASPLCIATYPGDFAAALIALDASVEIASATGIRTVAFSALHREPGDHPDVETSLRPDELIVSFIVPSGAWTRRSLYLKIRDRESYQFALASAAVAIELDGGRIAQARIALGGVATKPWRAREAEALLAGGQASDENFARAADAAFAAARSHGGNDYKIALGKRVVVRALSEATRLQI